MKQGDIFDGKYRILGVIGQGGTSTVYSAENIRLGMRWAIKEIHKTKNAYMDLSAEPNILKRLNHPALPRIIDILEDDERFYIIVDFIEGVSLMQKLEKEGKFKEATVLDWAGQLCEALIYLHSQQPNPIIYRDMKPSNIMLKPNGSLTLIDFGIAREYKPGSYNDTVCIGTRGYAAPEQYGSGQTDRTTDIFSLGITLYHLTTGKNPNFPPYGIKPVKELEPELSHEFGRIIDRCVRVDSTERYQMAEELLADIRAVSTPGSGRNAGTIATEYKSFRKLVLCIPDNCEFACELAYIIAKQTDFRLLIADMNYPESTSDIYLPLKYHEPKMSEVHGESPSELLSRYAAGDSLGPELTGKLARVCSGAGNLSVLELPFKDIVRNGLKIEKLADSFYRNNDITIFVMNWANAEDLKPLLLNSDYILAASAADTDSLRVCESYYMQAQKWGLNASSFKFVAYEYKNGVSSSLTLLNSIFGKGSLLGPVAYSPEREKCRNVRAYFCEEHYPELRKEYLEIMSFLGIIPKKSVRDMIFEYFYKKIT